MQTQILETLKKKDLKIALFGATNDSKKYGNIIYRDLKNKNIKANIKLVEDRLGHDRQYSINSNKLRALGWRPIYNFDEELEKMIDWYGDTNNLKIFKNINKHLLRKGIN